jgi:hypothetical protein
LPAVEKSGIVRLMKSHFEIGIVKNDIWILTAELKCDTLDASIRNNLLAHRGRSSESDFIDTTMSNQSISCFISITREHVDNTFWYSCLHKDFS